MTLIQAGREHTPRKTPHNPAHRPRFDATGPIGWSSPYDDPLGLFAALLIRKNSGAILPNLFRHSIWTAVEPRTTESGTLAWPDRCARDLTTFKGQILVATSFPVGIGLCGTEVAAHDLVKGWVRTL